MGFEELHIAVREMIGPVFVLYTLREHVDRLSIHFTFKLHSIERFIRSSHSTQQSQIDQRRHLLSLVRNHKSCREGEAERTSVRISTV